MESNTYETSLVIWLGSTILAQLVGYFQNILNVTQLFAMCLNFILNAELTMYTA